MLTRDGERVLEVLLVAAGLALATIFHDRLAISDPAIIPGAANAESVHVRQAADIKTRSSDLAELQVAAPAAVGPIEHALADFAKRLADPERSASRC